MHPAFVGDPADVRENLNSLIAQDARVLSNHLASIRQRLFPPAAQKTLRRFSSGEAATLIGISDVRPSSVLAGHKSLRELSATDVQLTMG